MQKKKNEGEELYGELGQAFNFTKGDLEANRAGFISHRQKEAYQYQSGCFGFLAIIFLIWTVSVLIYVLQSTTLNEASTGDAFSIIATFCFSLCSLMQMLKYAIPLYLISRNPRIAKKHGFIKPIGIGTERLKVADKEFRVKRNQYDFAWKQVPYITYYLQSNNVILSIEEDLSAEG